MEGLCICNVIVVVGDDTFIVSAFIAIVVFDKLL